MLLHTKLINVLGSGDKEIKIKSREVDTRMPALNEDEIKVLFEGKKDTSTIIAIIEAEFERLESIGYDPYITAYKSDRKLEIHQPQEQTRKSETHKIELYFH